MKLFLIVDWRSSSFVFEKEELYMFHEKNLILYPAKGTQTLEEELTMVGGCVLSLEMVEFSCYISTNISVE